MTLTADLLGCCCSVPSSGPRTERACTCPFPKEWFRAGCGRSMGLWCKIFVRLCGVVAGFVSCNRVGGLCLLWMWIMYVVSLFPSRRPAVSMSSCWLPARLRVGILNFACACAGGDFCDVLGAEAGFSLGRCCATSLCSILCWY